ncbi:hypothetical protein AYI69_g2543 [Smittium culicis]|uniref:Uncharacterized protein n=1 Tax=Smittium culicis TaxID=133412 RepID=A0A1R1YM86_9FUNG|nr:hypothetical protein AYI69_g2543 [Smittium culicis]
MSVEKLNTLLTTMKDRINLLDSSIQEQKEITKKELVILQNTLPKHIQTLVADEISNEIVPVVESNEDQFYVPDKMPTFRNGSGSIQDIEEFIVLFENCLKMNGLAPISHGTGLI